jgi:integrase
MATTMIAHPATSTHLALATELSRAGAAANHAAAAHTFANYQDRRSAQTLRRQRADLAAFVRYLAAGGVVIPDGAAALMRDPPAWAGLSWGLVSGFVKWQLKEGYAIGTINVRLATVKTYAKLAMQAKVIDPTTYAEITTVTGYRHAEGRNLDKTRATTRTGPKKAAAVTLTRDQANQLKQQPDTPQGRRDRLLLCLLLDHGLRVSELAALQIDAMDRVAGMFTFYRSKVDKVQTHRMTLDTLRATLAYFAHDAPAHGALLIGSQKGGRMGGYMSARAITERVRVLGARAGIQGLSAHDLRHYWATVAARSGTDLKSLQDGGGWSSPAMPMRYIERATIANHGIKLNE